ncbi:MAG: IPT/TIG domain-containing protein [Acidobacteriota bacterium]|nr:IPT/TIG domain-containing protein [Acidobacteriota bacterium]
MHGGPAPGPGRAGTAVPDPLSSWERVQRDRRQRRLWTAGLTVLAAVVVGLAAYTVHRSLNSSPTGSHRSPPPTSGGPGGTAPSATASSSSPNGPTVVSLTPSSGPAGQQVQISGGNLFSTDGQVLAHFGGQVAPTSCSSQTSCSAVAPPGTGRVEVTVTTAAGTSSPVWFTYR